MNKNRLLDKTFACLAASAIGDSMGALVEGWHTAIKTKYGALDALVPDLGDHLRGIKRVPYQSTHEYGSKESHLENNSKKEWSNNCL